jgi:SNF2 family DNA or RNA helicase
VTRRILKSYAPQEGAGGGAFATVTKILLTGTPVQNDVVDLWSLCNFIMPAVFRAREEFLKIYR